MAKISMKSVSFFMEILDPGEEHGSITSKSCEVRADSTMEQLFALGRKIAAENSAYAALCGKKHKYRFDHLRVRVEINADGTSEICPGQTLFFGMDVDEFKSVRGSGRGGPIEKIVGARPTDEAEAFRLASEYVESQNATKKENLDKSHELVSVWKVVRINP